MKQKLKIAMSVALILVGLSALGTLKALKLPSTGQLALITGSALSLVVGVGLLLPPIYQFVQGQVSAIKERRKRKPVVALDSNVLIGSFLYRHPEYAVYVEDFNPTYAKDDSEVMELIESNEIVGFVPYHWLRQAKNVLKEKYGMKENVLGKFHGEITNAGVKFSLNRYSPFSEEQIKAVSENFVHRKDKALVSEALHEYCDAIVTSDTRMVKNPSLIHYIPVLYTVDFIHALESGARTRKQLEREAYKRLELD